jgi:heme-degrading monooxygenase HmoA
MIRHIVTWKLSATDEVGKAAAFDQISGALNPLLGSIAGIRSLTVSRNAAFPDTNWDVVLLADYDSLDDLRAYQVHPEHVKAAAIVRANVSERASIDFEA